MTRYFDEKNQMIRALPKDDFITDVFEIEMKVITDVEYAIGDREFPEDLREKILHIIFSKKIFNSGVSNVIEPKFNQYSIITSSSELIKELHKLWHDVGSSRINTRYGYLSDDPEDFNKRRGIVPGDYIDKEKINKQRELLYKALE